MDNWFGKIAVLVSLLVYIIIRWPHGRRMGNVTVADDRKGKLEIGLLMLALVGTTLIPVIWLTTTLFDFANYELYLTPYLTGIVLMLFGLWLFHRSHSDLGTNWSVTLQTRETHGLITTGVYAKIRHPMYSSMFLMGVGQLLILPNWIAGPAYLLSFGILYIFRIQVEERMMLDHFGDTYQQYMQQTGRLIPQFKQQAND